MPGWPSASTSSSALPSCLRHRCRRVHDSRRGGGGPRRRSRPPHCRTLEERGEAMRKGRSIAGPADSGPVNRALSHPNTATIRTPCSSGGLAATGCCQDRGRQGRVTPATPEVTFSDLTIPTRSPGWPQTAAPNRTICPAQTHSPALGRRPNLPMTVRPLSAYRCILTHSCARLSPSAESNC